jgi:hypothetical protein
MAVRAPLALLAATLSCIGPGVHVCGDSDLVCADGLVCADDRDECAYPEQETVCSDLGLQENDVCYAGGSDGYCDNKGFCVLTTCGDTFVEGNEDCEAAGFSDGCVELGFHRGRLSCQACVFDTSDCDDLSWRRAATNLFAPRMVLVSDSVAWAYGIDPFGTHAFVVEYDVPELATKTTVYLREGAILSGHWRQGPDDIILVGGYRDSGIDEGLVLEWNGSAFIETPAPPASLSRVIKVSDDLFACSGHEVHRRQGSLWTEVHAVTPDAEQTTRCRGLASADGKYYALFDRSPDGELWVSDDGNSWSNLVPGVDMPNLTGLLGIWGEADTLVVSGQGGLVATLEGGQWTEMTAVNPSVPSAFDPAPGGGGAYAHLDLALPRVWGRTHGDTGSEFFVTGHDTLLTRFDNRWFRHTTPQGSRNARVERQGDSLVLLAHTGDPFLPLGVLFATRASRWFHSADTDGRPNADFRASVVNGFGDELLIGANGVFRALADHHAVLDNRARANYRDAWVDASGRVYAVGDDEGQPVIHRLGVDDEWETLVPTVPLGTSVTAVSGTGEDVFFLGKERVERVDVFYFAHFDGTSQWTAWPLNKGPYLAVHQDDVYVAHSPLFATGATLHVLESDVWKSGTGDWSIVHTFDAVVFRALAPIGDFLYMVTSDGIADQAWRLHTASGQLESVSTVGLGAALVDLAGDPDNLYGLARDGLWHFDGQSWAEIAIPREGSWTALRKSENVLRLVGHSGAAISYSIE